MSLAAQPRTSLACSLLLVLAISLGCTPACAGNGNGGDGAESAERTQARQRRIQQKFGEIQELTPQWVASGGNLQGLQTRIQTARELVQSGRIADAERRLDEVLELLKQPTAREPASGEDLRDAHVGEPRKVELARIPDDAAILFRRGREIFAMNGNGGNVTQITFDNPQEYEHVSASFDRTKLVSNRWGVGGGGSTLWLSDLVRGIEVQLVPEFASAGAGGVDWDGNGFIYFAGRKSGARERQDVYKIRHDGTGLERVVATAYGATDVGLSEDGRLVAYLEVVPRSVRGRDVRTHRAWVMDTDGRNQRLVYDVGEIDPERAGDFIGAADPTPSPDGRQLVFSMENPRHKNYPNISGLNTAHDLYVVNIDGSGLRRLTAEGPISIIPDWQGNEIVYTEINEAEDYRGISVVRQDDTGKRRLGPGNAAKWLRPRN